MGDPVGEPALIEAAAHVFVADVEDPVCDDADVHHLARVLRLRPGETVTACDGAGRWRLCQWTSAEGIEAAGEVVTVERPSPTITVGFSLLKGDRTEWVVQKLTEVGVDRVVPMTSARTIVRWDERRAARQLERLRRVAREAAMQSRRLWLPEVLDVTAFGDVAAAARETGPVAIAHFGGDKPSLSLPTVLVGPEGGWDEAEIDAALPTVTLGAGVLRAETAAVAAGILLTALRSGVVAASARKPPPGGPGGLR